MSKFLFLYSEPTASNQVVGQTPHGIYDSDSEYQTDSLTVCKYVASKLGHPVMQLEFNSGSMYACFEEAVSEYSQQINHYNTKNWMWEHYGNTTTGSNFSSTGSHQAETPNGGMSLFTLSEQYGQAVNVGGNTTMFTGSIVLTGSKQVYDLTSEASLESSISTGDGNRLEIQRVFNEGPAAISKFYDPFAGTYDNIELLDSFGFGNVSPAVSYILRPISYDLARANAIETNDLIRKAAYSFELINNKLRIFPKPEDDDAGEKIYFHYYRRNDRVDVTQDYTIDKVSDPSNIPYKFITYSEINSMGRNWIRKYTLALAKELLGIIRSKYASLPLPNGEVSMDGDALKSEGREEKANLLEELSTFLEAVSKKEQATTEQEVANSQQEVLNKAPLKIYIG
jgi:hypothetical protein|tara:strand:+ start:141 stop:1331 length:1191 start_codon:yes stop_codon:yes gene_type:complete